MNRLSIAAPTTRLGTLTGAAVALWFLGALVSSLTGVFDTRNRPPLALASWAILPVLIFAFAYPGSLEFRRFVLSANPRLLTLAHTWRVAGITFLILYYRGQLPAAFALPAGWGDIAIGITAPVIAFAMIRRKVPNPLLIAWNSLGLLDLALAIMLGVLSSNGPLGILAHGVTTQIMGRFPLSLIPTFLVPLFIIFHVIVLAQIRQSDRQQ
ncbi:MAG TPA: hypothetical protein VGQ99_01385 [Tepidisphaeraceae bacterium]|jgi:hypothetical protein|nr:hypothetical protein [Tepidisphaeraceae bacterium]